MSLLREVQLLELQMLKDVARVCENNNITYTLAYGTLLGAVRHGGFIPWDDDIDIILPLGDYKKFIKIAQKELGEKYFVQNYKTEPEYNEMWTKIRVNGTTSMSVEDMAWNINWGICIDVFPLVGVSKDEDLRKKQNKALSFNRLLLSDKKMIAKNEKFSTKQKLLYAVPRGIRKKICEINERNYMLDPYKYDYCTIIWTKLGKNYNTHLFDEYIKLPFEDSEFNCVSDYDRLLTIAYGDYMQLPPEDKRGGHAIELGTIIFDCKKSYKEYKK